MGWLPTVVGLQRGRYFARRPLAYCLLRTVDFVCAVFRHAFPQPERFIQPPNTLLLCNGAHLGDVMLTLSVISALKRQWPSIKIGVLVGSWSSPLVEGHPDISFVHYMDHWKLNRSSRPFWEKIRRYLSMRRKVVRDIEAVGYDAAVDFYFFFPNAAILLSQANISTRLGYSSGGFGGFYTHPLHWSTKAQSVVQYHFDLLRILCSNLSDAIPDPQAGVAASLNGQFSRDIAESTRLPAPGYVLLHPGAGDPAKEWPIEGWQELLRNLLSAGHRVVFSGSGARECAQVNQIQSGFQGITNLCGQLKWSEFIYLVKRARVLVGVDSVAGHVAAAVGTPCVIIRTGMNNPWLWRPLSDKCEYLVVKTPCTLGHLKPGVKGTASIHEITPDRALIAIKNVLIEKAKLQ
jgi:ADP-heptose:LPS heptosyltransferase